MSKVTISGNASGTGVFTIAAPNSNTDRTLTLPDEAGTVLTSASDIASSQLTGDAVPIGVGQSWTDVTASRSSNVTYTNSTGQPIMIAYTSYYATPNEDFYVDGVRIAIHRNSVTGRTAFSFIVPNGSTYRIVSIAGINFWFELR